MASASAADTKRRLITAASQLFAAHGFRGTTMRNIAARARVNLASGHYHYGSKKELYLAVLRAQFAEIRELLAQRGALREARELQTLTRPALETLLRVRTRAMLDLLIGLPLGVHATLMQREMVDPTEALPIIVDEFVQVMMVEVEQIIERLEPGLQRSQVRHSAFSIVGQCLFYRFTMPALLRVMGRSAFPRDTARLAAEHISEFSLGGLERLAKQRRLRAVAARGRAAPRLLGAHLRG